MRLLSVDYICCVVCLPATDEFVTTYQRLDRRLVTAAVASTYKSRVWLLF